jgi:hypothetical protein
MAANDVCRFRRKGREAPGHGVSPAYDPENYHDATKFRLGGTLTVGGCMVQN